MVDFQGLLVNWEVERTIWDYTFGRDVFNVDSTNTCLIITQPLFSFTSIIEGMNEMFFEEYQFDSLLQINGMVYTPSPLF